MRQRLEPVATMNSARKDIKKKKRPNNKGCIAAKRSEASNYTLG
jgi:hypothetical protein